MAIRPKSTTPQARGRFGTCSRQWMHTSVCPGGPRNGIRKNCHASASRLLVWATCEVQLVPLMRHHRCCARPPLSPHRRATPPIRPPWGVSRGAAEPARVHPQVSRSEKKSASEATMELAAGARSDRLVSRSCWARAGPSRWNRLLPSSTKSNGAHWSGMTPRFPFCSPRAMHCTHGSALPQPLAIRVLLWQVRSRGIRLLRRLRSERVYCHEHQSARYHRQRAGGQG